jgi:hypothetical protein
VDRPVRAWRPPECSRPHKPPRAHPRDEGWARSPKSRGRRRNTSAPSARAQTLFVIEPSCAVPCPVDRVMSRMLPCALTIGVAYGRFPDVVEAAVFFDSLLMVAGSPCVKSNGLSNTSSCRSRRRRGGCPSSDALGHRAIHRHTVAGGACDVPNVAVGLDARSMVRSLARGSRRRRVLRISRLGHNVVSPVANVVIPASCRFSQ